MSRTVVVLIDPTQVDDRAVPVAASLARQLGANLKLIAVFEMPPEYLEWTSLHPEDEYVDQRTGEIKGILEDIALELQPLDVSTLVLLGSDPAVEIDEAVKQIDDPLVVMSTQAQSRIVRLVLGSVATRMIQMATYPLVIVPADCREAPESISRILIPLDGSSFAEHALDITIDIFTGEQMTAPAFHLLRLVERIFVESKFEERLRGELFEHANLYLSQIADRISARSLEASWEVDETLDVAKKIVKDAEEADADMVAMATHGRTGFSRLFLGSVADGVIRTATMPVLIVRPSDDVVNDAPASRVSRKRVV